MIHVVDGEPTLQISGVNDGAFRYLHHCVTGEDLVMDPSRSKRYDDEAARHSDVWEREFERARKIRMNVSKRTFQFTPTECCSDLGRIWHNRDLKYSVPVKKTSHGQTWWDHRQVRTCQCDECRGSVSFSETGKFLLEVTRVRIEV